MLRTPNRSAEDFVPITKSDDSNDDIEPTRGLYVGAGLGNLVVVTRAGNQRTITNLAVGIIHPISIVRVVSTGTDASYTGILGVL